MMINDVVMAYRGFATKHHTLTCEEFEKTTPNWSYDEFKTYIEAHGLSADNFVVIDGREINNFYYADFESGFYFEAYFDKGFYEMSMPNSNQPLIDTFNLGAKRQRELLQDGEYHIFYFHIPTTFQMLDFTRRHKTIDKDKVFEVWKDIYTSADYGFSLWSEDVLQYVFSQKRPKVRKFTEPVTIYRGMGNKSTPLEKAYSWTTSLQKAIWFATKNRCGVKVYQGTVNPEDIIAYINDRGEHEIIVMPQDVKNVRTMDYIEPSERFIISMVKALQPLYLKHGKNINELLYIGGQHGLKHIQRVLFYALMFVKLSGENLTAAERDILIYFSIMHDVGRVNEDEDEDHGVAAVKRIEAEALNVPSIKLTPKALVIAKLLIALHCVDDAIGIKTIRESKELSNHERRTTEKLYQWCKDIDGLDRARLEDLDPSYLRTEYARKNVLVATYLYQNRVETLLNNC